jgi:membrane protease YdiL (CAAX protease family)
MVHALSNGGSYMSKGAKINLALDVLVALSFLVCAVSGVYFLFAPTGSVQRAVAGQETGFLFSRTTWDMLHTWSGVVLISTAVVHFAIHWRWVKNVTRKFFLSLLPQPAAGRQLEPRQQTG